ncbi:hypothetical protein PIB30_011762 [Stylosanthes scabra]|uniref:Uncharacterized protein n=1 Tax=Stylosanthes scabra TaxID=79078 RepID=A0ABU6Q5V2_9FABA|nr:hypothetical protein [Stylosanthes scabra]
MFRQEPTAQAQGINPMNFADNSRDHNRQVSLIDDESDIDSSWDNEDVIEAFESKKVWGKSGLHFGSSDEEELLDRLSRKKGEKRKHERHRQGRKPPSILGRTLATRVLRSGKSSKDLVWIEVSIATGLRNRSQLNFLL